MDASVGLVQAYLRVNGFFTVTEYPIIAQRRKSGVTLTDIDILAVRFPGASRWIPGQDKTLPPDPVLDIGGDHLQMIIGEVKEGKPRLNRASSSREVVETAIRRFGCCSHAPTKTADAVLRNGYADSVLTTGMRCRVCWIVFSGSEAESQTPYRVITFKHVFTFLSEHLRIHGDTLLHSQFKDDALDLVSLLVKAGLPLDPGGAGTADS